MNLQEKYFLVVAKESSITNAAKKLYISQQCLSRHIHELESQYGVLLFNRKPTLSLTPAGECIARNLSKIAAMEASMMVELENYNRSAQDTVRFGILQMYFTTFAYEMLPRFQAICPETFLDIVHAGDESLIPACQNANIDLFFSRFYDDYPLLQFELLVNAVEFAVVPDSLLRNVFGNDTDEISRMMEQNGFDIHLCESIPFIIQNKDQRESQTRFFEYAAQHGSQIKIITACGGISARVDLAKQGFAAFFTTSLGVHYIKTHILSGDAPPLRFFPLLDYGTIPLAVGWQKGRFLSHSEHVLVDVLKEIFHEINRDIFEQYPVLSSHFQ